MSSIKDIKLFTTQIHPCSYLPEQDAQTLFIDPEFSVDTTFHTRLSEIGFRRSGNHIYRPHCAQCQHCVPCRILVDDFKPGRRFRRIMKNNSDVTVEEVPSIDTDECFELYSHYINTRHHDGDMYPANREQFSSFLIEGCVSTRYYLMKVDSKLIGVMVSDQLDNALSAVYTYYDINHSNRSLGNFAILWQIEKAQKLALPYLYLGYWIRDCEKMNYKTQYKPQELLISQRWIKLS